MAFFERFIRNHFDRHFFESVHEAIDGAFASAYHRAAADDRVLPTQLAHARGTDRYFAVQSAVMQAAVAAGALPVDHRAGSFPMPLARHRRFLVATVITDSLEHLRRSRARRLLAELNGFFEPQQRDLWEEPKPPTGETLFGMLLVAKSTGPDQRLPLGVYFGVPTSSLRSWHFYADVNDISSMYSDDSKLIPQRPGPKLRAVRRSAESGSRTEEGGES